VSWRSTAVLFLIALALAAVFLARTRPQREQEGAGSPEVWSLDPAALVGVTIELPRLDRRESWIRGADGRWAFQRAGRPAVDGRRWSGVPTLLSGPRAERLVAVDTPSGRSAAFGLTRPAMRIELLVDGEEPLRIEVGDATPDGAGVYVQAPGSTSVYSVARSWYTVLVRLVTDPPYPASDR
jgi:hypothetical protein